MTTRRVELPVGVTIGHWPHAEAIVAGVRAGQRG
jgi:hypothetical protein